MLAMIAVAASLASFQHIVYNIKIENQHSGINVRGLLKKILHSFLYSTFIHHNLFLVAMLRTVYECKHQILTA